MLDIVIISITSVAFVVGEDVCLSKDDIALSYFDFTLALEDFVAQLLM